MITNERVLQCGESCATENLPRFGTSPMHRAGLTGMRTAAKSKQLRIGTQQRLGCRRAKPRPPAAERTPTNANACGCVCVCVVRQLNPPCSTRSASSRHPWQTHRPTHKPSAKDLCRHMYHSLGQFEKGTSSEHFSNSFTTDCIFAPASGKRRPAILQATTLEVLRSVAWQAQPAHHVRALLTIAVRPSKNTSSCINLARVKAELAVAKVVESWWQRCAMLQLGKPQVRKKKHAPGHTMRTTDPLVQNCWGDHAGRSNLTNT